MAAPADRPLQVRFFCTDAGNEPVREWLLKLDSEHRKIVGGDIKAVQWRWPVGKPLVDSLGTGLWEIRTSLGDRIARVFFIVAEEKIVLLHGIIKKSQIAPQHELQLARKRQSMFLAHESKSTAKRKSPPRE